MASGLPETFVAVATHEASKSLLEYAIERYRSRNIWRVADPTRLAVCVSADSPSPVAASDPKPAEPPMLRLRPGAGAAHVRAAMLAGLSLHNAYGRFSGDQLRLSVEGSISDDLVLLGSPDHNAVSREVLDEIHKCHPNLWLKRFGGGSLEWRLQGASLKTFTGEETPDGLVEQDYGVILRIKNPFATEARRTVVLLAGCTTFGTLAAVRAFTRPISKDHAKLMRQKHDFGCLVAARVRHRDDVLSGIAVVDFQRL